MQANMEENLNVFLSLLGKITAYKLNEPMSKHTSFACGGQALVYTACEEKITAIIVIYLAKLFNLPLVVLGNGSNVLFSDKGFNGIVLKLKGNNVDVNGETLNAFAGTKLSFLSNEATRLSLTGLEFIHGIPGSVGGAVYMNAGCFGSSIADVLFFADCLDVDSFKPAANLNMAKKTVQAIVNNEVNFTLLHYTNKELNFSYRRSLVKEKKLLVLRAAFKLKKGDKHKIESTIKTMQQKRKASQPLEYPSAGSFFKRPANNFAGALIEQAGLKGLSVGGARVSEKHAGFIVNTGGASASDVYKLSKEVQNKVYQKFQVMLEPEVEFIGF